MSKSERFTYGLALLSALVLLSPLSAQTRAGDSLRLLLKQNLNDTSKINAINELGWHYVENGRLIEADSLARKALALSEKIKFSAGISSAYNTLGATTKEFGNYPEALEYYRKALKINEQLGDQRGAAGKLNNIGTIYMFQNNFPAALRNFYSALSVNNKLGNKKWAAINYSNIGIVFKKLGKPDKAIKYYFAALKMADETGNRKLMCSIYIKIGELYSAWGNTAKGLQYGEKSFASARQIGFRKGEISALSSMGVTNKQIGDLLVKKSGFAAKAAEAYKKAEYCFSEAVEWHRLAKDKNAHCVALGNLGMVFGAMGNMTKAEKYLLEALVIGEELKNYELTEKWNSQLSIIYKMQKKWETSLKHYKEETRARDSLLNERNIRESVQAEMNFNFEKKETLLKEEEEKKDAVRRKEKERQKALILGAGLLLALMIAFAAFVYRSFLQKKKISVEITKQKELIEEKQKEILDSIRYARRIQNALMPSEKYIEKMLR